MKILHFPSTHPYLKRLQSNPTFEPWTFTPWSEATEPSSEAGVFILVSPFEVQEKYVAPDHIWKKYLQQHAPQCKFFNLSIYPSDQPNHLYLFGLPDDFTTSVQAAPALADHWEPYVFGAMDARDRLQDFLEGHGGMSFYKPLYRLKSLLQDIQREKTEGIPYAETWEELGSDVLSWWDALCTRWQRYQDFFQILPLSAIVNQIATELHQITPFFAAKGTDEQLLYDLNCIKALDSIDHQLKTMTDYASH